jgi:threonine/homoserine/homoserine lactone efflux protein
MVGLVLLGLAGAFGLVALLTRSPVLGLVVLAGIALVVLHRGVRRANAAEPGQTTDREGW